MLEFFRKASTSWFFRGFFLVLAIAFGFLWGIGDVVTRFTGSGHQTVISIGSKKVTARDFEYAVAREVEMIQMQTGKKIDRRQAAAMGVDEMVLQQLVNNNLFELEAKRLGLVVSDEMIRRRIQGEKIFQDQAGNFNKDRFIMIINRLGYNEKDYVEHTRKEMLREELIKALASGLAVPDVMALPLYTFQSEKRDISVVSIKSSTSLVKNEPTEEDLRKFFNDNKEQFKASELRSLRALVFDKDRLLSKVPVDDQKLQEEFDSRQEDFKGKTLDNVRDELKKSIQQQQVNEYIFKLSNEVEDAMAGGQPLESVAKNYDLDVVMFSKVDAKGMTESLEDVNQSKTTELSDLQKAILKQAFLQEISVPGDLVDVGNGRFFVVEVTDVIPAQYRSFESIKDKLTPYWKRAQAVLEARKIAAAIKEGVAKGESFESLVRKNNLTFSPLQISRSGVSETSKIKISKKLIAQAYTGRPGDIFFDVVEGEEYPDYLLVRLNNIEAIPVKERTDEVNKLAVHIRNGLIEDTLALYLAGAEKRYPVDMNKRYFDSAYKS